MKQEFDNKLCQDFPNLYRERYQDPKDTCMAFGFEVDGDGWNDLIYELSAKLEKLILELPEEERKDYKAAQVKQKFGGLRYYLDGETDEMRILTREAEEKSFHICEECSEPGRIRNRKGWLTTLCDEHALDK